MEIVCPGNYTISTCNGASWDTYLYLSTAPCGGTVLASNDDNCGLQSSITTFLQAGTYYLVIEFFSSFSQGDFNLDISKSCALDLSLNPVFLECGYNISCNGLSDGEVFSSVSNSCGSLAYSWSDGSTAPNLSGASAGSYRLIVTDDFGCSAVDNVVLTEPNVLSADAGNDQTVYYGYTPQSCADLSGAATGGCAEYSFSWSESGIGTIKGEDISVCPTLSSDYTLTVTDQNGCSASDDVHVCVVDVTCYAGNSQVQKVEMCHIPHGNSGNPQTICINESAVAAHLAHGCSLGACSEQGICSNSGARYVSEHIIEEYPFNLMVSPNPTSDKIEIEMNVSEEGSYEIELVNAYGQLVKNVFNGHLSPSDVNILAVDLFELSSGIYFLKANRIGGRTMLYKVYKM